MKSLYISKTEKATWANSQVICNSYGMELASFDIPNEIEFLLTGYEKLTNKPSNTWIGYTDEGQEGIWTNNKINLLPKNVGFHNGEPSNSEGKEHCLEVCFLNNQYKFNDNQCFRLHHFICELKVTLSNVDELKANLADQKLKCDSDQTELKNVIDTLKTENINLQNKFQTLENSCKIKENTSLEEKAQQKIDFESEIVKLTNQVEKLKIDLAEKDNQLSHVNDDCCKDRQICPDDNAQLQIDLKFCNEQYTTMVKENSNLRKLNTSTLNCDYEDNGQYYSCNTDSFEIIKENSNIDVHGTHQVDKTDSDVVEVNFKNCKTQRFSNAIFEHFSNLENLNIVSSSLNYLTQGVFNGAGRLRKLNIKGNNIKAITYYVFEGAGGLNVLKMENNNIEFLSTEAFKGLNNLQTLSLKNNRIKDLPVSIFVDLTNLRYLVFSSNELQELDAKLFEKNKEIREFWFENNNLTKIDSEMFSYSPYVKRAVFTNNNCINMDSQNVCQEMFKTQVNNNCKSNF